MIVDIYQMKETIKKSHPSLVGADFKTFIKRCAAKNLSLHDVFAWKWSVVFCDNADFDSVKVTLDLRRGSLVVVKNSALDLNGAYYYDTNYNPVEFNDNNVPSVLPNGWIPSVNDPNVSGTYYVQSKSGKVFLAKFKDGAWSHKNILYWQPKPLPIR